MPAIQTGSSSISTADVIVNMCGGIGLRPSVRPATYGWGTSSKEGAEHLKTVNSCLKFGVSISSLPIREWSGRCSCLGSSVVQTPSITNPSASARSKMQCSIWSAKWKSWKRRAVARKGPANRRRCKTKRSWLARQSRRSKLKAGRSHSLTCKWEVCKALSISWSITSTDRLKLSSPSGANSKVWG